MNVGRRARSSGPAEMRLEAWNMPAVLVLFMVVIAALLDLFGFTEVVPTVAKTAFFVVPVVFMVSLAVGLIARKRA